MLTPKENYLRVLHKEIPEYIPMYTFGKMPGDTEEPANALIEPALVIEHRLAGGGKDIWGVEYVPTAVMKGTDVAYYHVAVGDKVEQGQILIEGVMT